MIHMEVAYRLIQKWDWIKYPAEFIVASVSPDSIHMNDNYQVEMKVRSHLFENCGPWGDTQDYEQWIRNIKNFWNERGSNCLDEKTKSYVAGVCVHCLTDRCNDLDIWRRLQKQYIPPLTMQSFKEEYYPEAAGIDLWLFQTSPNKEEIVELFKSGECLELDGLLKSEEIEKQKQHMLEIQYNKEKIDIADYKYLSSDFLMNFIDDSVNKIDALFQDFLGEKKENEN